MSATIGVVLFFTIAVLVIFLVVMSWRSKKKEIYSKHGGTLAYRKRALTQDAGDGKKNYEFWELERDYFILNVYIPEIGLSGAKLTQQLLTDCRNNVAAMISGYKAAHRGEKLKDGGSYASPIFDMYVRCNQQVDQHKETLARKFKQLVYQDDYGNFVFDKWEAELNYFMSKVLELPDSDEVLKNFFKKKIVDAIRNIKIYETQYHPGLSGVEYEHYCEQIVMSVGWDAKRTQASGDQGADIIAERSGVRVVIQCKHFSSPVGNSAVQEVNSARQFYNGHFAAVVTNNTYTPSARALANSCNIALLTHDQLEAYLNSVSETVGGSVSECTSDDGGDGHQ